MKEVKLEVQKSEGRMSPPRITHCRRAQAWACKEAFSSGTELSLSRLGWQAATEDRSVHAAAGGRRLANNTMPVVSANGRKQPAG